MTLYQRLMFKKGLHWQRNRPPLPWRAFAIIALCTLAYSAVAKYDRLEQRAVEMEILAESNAGLAEVTLNCLNGASGFYFKDAKLAFSCGGQL